MNLFRCYQMTLCLIVPRTDNVIAHEYEKLVIATHHKPVEEETKLLIT